MKLGIGLSHWWKDTSIQSTAGLFPLEVVERLKECEGYGCDSVWVPESYHQEAFTFLSWIGANTSQLKLATHIAPIQARSPALCAQAAVTLDHLSRGRAMVGLGVTGVDVAEAWHGQAFTRPVARTREYISVMRKVLEGKRPENVDGEFYPLPVRDGISTRTSALKPTQRPYRADLPILIGAMGPKNIALAAEIADGWCSTHLPLGAQDLYRGWLNEGFSRPGARHSWADFQITVTLAIVVDDDLQRAADRQREELAYAICEMGSQEHNFQYNQFVRSGFEEQANRVRSLWQDGDHKAAAAAIPISMIDEVALIGSRDRIRDRLQLWKDSIATTLVVHGDFEAVRTVAETGLFETP